MSWTEDARSSMDDLINTRSPFTADDLVASAGHPDPSHGANGRNSQIGSLFQEYSRAKLIVPTGTVKNSTQPHRKGGMIREWIGK